METTPIESSIQPLSTQSLFPPTLLYLAFLLAITISTHLIHRDYAEFKSLGPGGTPSTIPGYLRVKFLSLFAIRNPYLPSTTITWPNRPSYLTKLPKREGTRPTVRGIAPHRQSDQKASLEIFQKLRDRIFALAVGHPMKLRHGTSCLEKHGPGLFARNVINRSRHCNGEVCHAHPSDGSIHLTLHPADAAIVLQQAWGERHPLSTGGWLARFVPPGFVMVYAPRNEEEVDVVMGIVKAAVWWVAGTDLEERIPMLVRNVGS
ncbi:hypothetical protein EJ08DRAFT_670182 [Tothia fuscella]|uniref:Luciferase domain-containing protein n=1 Tax=Tothia fuscella TaxID=1048955 RepID=A0A9P4NT13_9PEZI|nr:hypothetical protein EJ08DRAFT_670182 [Tothia fuscella]